jgi:tripartite-type tricarboxylate transporter receptor subunit TctC
MISLLLFQQVSNRKLLTGRAELAKRIHRAAQGPQFNFPRMADPTLRALIHPTVLFFFAAILSFFALSAHAETYPSKSIKIVVPYPAAGTPDILSREVAAKLTKALGQQVIVDNRPGAGGNIGSDLVAKSAPDGYTLIMATVATHSINQALYKKLPFDPIKDFAPIILVATTPNVLVVNPKLPVKTVKDLIALAKSKPGELTFASGGNGTSHHIGGSLFQKLTGVQMTHVPYKGSGAALPDMIGGQVDIMFDNLTSSMPHIKSGKLRAIATTGTTRSAALPDLPTVAEAGVPGFEITAWFGLLAPANTPQAILNRLNREVTKILTLPEMTAKLIAQGAEPAPGTPQQLAQFIKDKTAQWAPIVKASGAQID